MNNLLLPLLGCLLVCTTLQAADRYDDFSFNADQERYIRRFSKIAVQEMERTGVPASIKLAQGILESGSGDSYLARTANNHFGIKCGSNWQGDKVFRKDDDYDDNGRLVKSCFRKYRNADASFVAHSEFLRDPKKSFRYGFLFRLDPTDYQAWAEGLRRAGYATNPRYPELLVNIIERYNLTQYDSPGAVDPIDIDTPTEELIAGILRTNDVSYYVSEAPMSVAEVARQVELSVDRLIEYNEGITNANTVVNNSDRVYLQRKRRSYRGKEKYYEVQPGEDLYDVAQKFALRLDVLARRNRLAEGDDPATGEKLKLRGWSRIDEKPRLEGQIDPNALPEGGPAIPTNPDGTIDLFEPGDDRNPGTTPPTRPSRPVIINPNPNPTDPNTAPPVVDDIPEGPGVPNVGPIINPNPPGQPAATTVHTVQAGETLYAISRRYGLTVDELKTKNGLTSNALAIGQRLRID